MQKDSVYAALAIELSKTYPSQPIKVEGTDCFLYHRLLTEKQMPPLTEKRMLLVKSEIPSTLMGEG